jgi:polysaccharide export outer membrane protein
MTRKSLTPIQLCAATLAAYAGLALGPARAEYLLQPGDVLEIGVASIAELKQRVPVGIDGKISYPMLGELEVAGMSVSGVQRALGDILPSKIYQMRAMDGRELNVSILSQEITVRVAEYKPVYMSGDVAKPGELVYRPGLTVRQAVALAGGYDIMRFRMNNPFLEASDLRSEYNGLWLDFAKSQARLARLDAELEGRSEMLKTVVEAPLPPKVLEQIIANEAEQLRRRNEDMRNEKAFIDKATKDVQNQAALLEESLQRESMGVEADRKELEEIRVLMQRGTVASTRVADARRASLLSASQWMQTSSQASQARKQILDLARQWERTVDSRRQEILREKQEEGVKLAALRARINAVAEKLLYTGAVKTQLLRGVGNKPQMTIFRKRLDQEERIVASEDTELQPGDVIDVALEVAPVDAIAN